MLDVLVVMGGGDGRGGVWGCTCNVLLVSLVLLPPSNSPFASSFPYTLSVVVTFSLYHFSFSLNHAVPTFFPLSLPPIDYGRCTFKLRVIQ